MRDVSLEYSMAMDEMADAVRALRIAAQGIAYELRVLDSASTRLRANWSGDATTAYERAHSAWTAELARLNWVLDRAAQAAEGTVDRHLAARAEVAKLWM